MDDKLIITIGRQFGSGGAFIGQTLAEMLSVNYYDKRLITEAAERTGLSSEVFENKDERTPGSLMHALSLGFGFHTGFSEETIFAYQSETIRAIAARESCVIVGRCADYVLREHPGCVSIFIHAPAGERSLTVADRRGISGKEAADMIERTDKTRAAYYNFYTEKRWGHCASYDLSIDSSVMGYRATAEFIRDYIAASRKALLKDQKG